MYLMSGLLVRRGNMSSMLKKQNREKQIIIYDTEKCLQMCLMLRYVCIKRKSKGRDDDTLTLSGEYW